MPTPTDALTFLTVAEAAALLRVHPRTLHTRIRDGRLPAKRLAGGKAVLLDRRDVLALLEDAHGSGAPLPDLTNNVVTPDADPPSIPPKGMIDRLGTLKGRARAIEMLRRLRDEADAEEQRRAWAVLQKGVRPLSLRRWDAEPGDRREDGTG